MSCTYSGVIGEFGTGTTLTKTGDGSQVLDGANAYTGATTVSGGTLGLGASGSIATSASLSVAAGATLDTSGQSSYAIPASQPVDFGIAAAGAGSSGTITAAELDISNATVTYAISGTPDDAVYVLATYTNLVGANFLSAPAPPTGYTLNYAFEGNKIALESTAATPYDTWASDNGLSGGDADLTADTENSGDGDGLNQLLEFAFGTNPNASDNVALTVTDGTTFTPGIPQVEQIFDGGNPVKFRYVRLKEHVAAGLTYTPQFSDSLDNFVPDVDNPVPVVISDAGGDYEVVEVPFPLFDGGGQKAASLFGQVVVTLDP